MAESLSSITGLSSGIDSKALVDQMMSVERRTAVRMESTIAANNKRSAALAQFQTAMDTLKAATASLTDGTAFDAVSTTVIGSAATGRSTLTATASAGAIPGSYQVKVLSLASAQKSTASAGQTSTTTPLGVTGTFELRRPDDTVLGSVTLDGTETLAGVRDKINAASTTAKLQTSIVSTKADGTDQRLVIASQQTGTAGAFKLVATAGDPLTALGLATPITQGGTDAKAEIDGVMVTRSTNTMSDVVTGVTFNLTAEDPTAVSTVTVGRVANSSSQAVQAMVDAFNAVQAFIKKEGAPGGALATEPLVRAARGAMSGILLAKGTGLALGMETLGSIGVALTREGTLSFDQTKFTSAYTNKYDDLKATLKERTTAISKFAESLTKSGTGTIASRTTAITDANGRLTSRVADIDARLEKKRAALLAQFAKFEASLGGINAMGKTISAQLSGLNAKSDG
jgi:flagellar hook-associated protein 2